MSLMDMFKAFGGGGQNPIAQAFDLDPSMVKMARFQALGNIGTQLMALGQQQTPAQRAQLMGNLDFSGGYQDNLMGAAKLQMMGREQKQKQAEYDRMEQARQQIADMIKQTPPGRLRDAAMYFFQSGDLGKAGELLWTQKREYDATTGGERILDGLGTPIGAPAVAPTGGVPTAPATGGAPMPGPAPTAVPAAPGAVPPMPAAQEPVNQATLNWRRITGDPNLTQDEARQIMEAARAAGNSDAGLKLYREMRKQQAEMANKEQDQDQTALQGNRTAAEALTSKFAEQTKSYDTIIGAGQRAAQVASSPNMSAADKLTTLYQFMKALDPEGAVREGDVAMAQSMQSLKDQWTQWAEAQLRGGGPISEVMVMDMARSMSRLANDATGRKELKRLELIRRAQGRQVPLGMVTDADPDGSQNMRAPIGLSIPRAAQVQQTWPRITLDAARDLQGDPSPEAMAEFDETFGPGAANRVITRNGGR